MHKMVTPTEWTTVDYSLNNQTTDENRSSEFIDSEFRYTLFPVFYGLVFVFGLAANIYALYVLHHMRESKAMNEIRIYMTNLTVADLLFVSALPFWIGYYAHRGDWKFSDPICRIAGTFFFINTYCSVLFLAVITVNRYWAVTKPLVAASSDCWRRGAIISAAVWVITLAASVQFLIEPGVQEDKGVSRCFEGYHNVKNDTKNSVAATHFLIIGLFFLVFSLVIMCNISIARTLLSQPISQPRASTGRRPSGTKRRALRMLCAVVGVFVICFLPHHVVQGPWVLSVLRMKNWRRETHQLLNDAHQITLMLMGFNCILDPLVYCFATTKFRKYIKGHLKMVRNNKNCSRNTLSTAVSLKSRFPIE